MRQALIFALFIFSFNQEAKSGVVKFSNFFSSCNSYLSHLTLKRISKKKILKIHQDKNIKYRQTKMLDISQLDDAKPLWKDFSNPTDVTNVEILQSFPVGMFPPQFNEAIGSATHKIIEIKSAIQNGEIMGAVRMIVDNLYRSTVIKYTPINRMVTSIYRALEVTFYGTTKELYAADSIVYKNTGLINYLSEMVAKDEVLRNQAIRYYRWLRRQDIKQMRKHLISELKQHKLDDWQFKEGRKRIISMSYGALYNETLPSAAAVWDSTKIDTMAKAMEITGGDFVNATTIRTIFGHDNENNLLNLHSFTRANKNDPIAQRKALLEGVYLNSIRPEIGSLLYKPGSLGGITNTPETIDKFRALQNRWQELSKQGIVENPPESFRAAFYHSNAAAFLSMLLIKDGLGTVAAARFPVVLSVEMARYYKLIAMHNSYLSQNAKTLFDLGYPKSSFEKVRKKAIQQGVLNNDECVKAKLVYDTNEAFIKQSAEELHMFGSLYSWQEMYKISNGVYPTVPD